MPKPIEYVAKDGTRTWRVRVRDKGRNTSETFHTKRQADQFCKLVAAIGASGAIADLARRDKISTDYTPTLREYLPQHITQLTGVTDRTRLDYAAMAKRTFLPHLGDHPLDTIDRAAVSKTINALEAQGLSAKSIANAHGLLSAIMATAVVNDLIGLNPCHRMRLPKSREHERRDERFLTHEEYHRLLAATPAAHRPLLVALFGTGLRWGEITALQVRDIQPTTPPTLRVTKAWKSTPGRPRHVGPPKSGKSRRTVMLPAQVMEALAPLLGRDGDALLFTGPRGGPVHHGPWRERVWVPACKTAGLVDPVPRIHDARHTHASWLIEQGATLEMVQDQLGHESILTTRKVYGHLQPAMRAALADAATRAMAMGAAPLQIED